jgi:hypothetical protein
LQQSPLSRNDPFSDSAIDLSSSLAKIPDFCSDTTNAFDMNDATTGSTLSIHDGACRPMHDKHKYNILEILQSTFQAWRDFLSHFPRLSKEDRLQHQQIKKGEQIPTEERRRRGDQS